LAAEVEELKTALGEAHVAIRVWKKSAEDRLAPTRTLEMIREEAAMPTSRFCARLGIPRRSYVRWQARERAGRPAEKGPWPAPVVDPLEPVAAKYAADWPAWGHRKIHAMMAVDGHEASVSSVERALRRRDLLQPVDYQRERRQLAKARKAAFADRAVANLTAGLLRVRDDDRGCLAARRRLWLLLEVRVRLAHLADHDRRGRDRRGAARDRRGRTAR